ncbi:MAG TPA: aldo/keto reductase, partial [Thermoanaerobaculia bacterium]|nr:aldo/keto reductase [Thermoanaerobaculia bacterium]
MSAHRRAHLEALEAGVNLVDTSTNYADRHSETLVGEVLAAALARGFVRREDVVVVTKAGYLQ